MRLENGIIKAKIIGENMRKLQKIAEYRGYMEYLKQEINLSNTKDFIFIKIAAKVISYKYLNYTKKLYDNPVWNNSYKLMCFLQVKIPGFCKVFLAATQ